MRRILLFIFFALLIGSKIYGQGTDSLSSQQDKKLKIIPLPALFYTPETRLGYGALTSGVFNLGEKTTTRNSNAQLLAAYTLNKQIILQSKHNIFTNREAYVLNGELSYYDFPILYYGIGNDTKEEFEEDLQYQVVEIRERVLKQIWPHFFAGLQYRFTNLYDLSFEPEFLVADKPLLAANTGINSGIGFSVAYDNRDNVLNASKGVFFNFSSFYYQKAFGSDFTYNRYTLDLRKFWSIDNKSVLASQLYGEFNTSGVPFREMAQMGGDMIMRGYYNGRFRDNQQMAFQTECRRQVLPWLGLTGFAAVGDVSDEISNFSLADFKWTAGAGLRFLVNKSDRLNIRVDYGFGESTSGFYFAFAEAF